MEKGEEDDEKGMRWKSGPFRSPSRPRYLLQYAEYVQGVQGTQFRLPLKRIEDSRDGGMDGGGGATLTVQADKKKKSRYPISMDDGVSLLN